LSFFLFIEARNLLHILSLGYL